MDKKTTQVASSTDAYITSHAHLSTPVDVQEKGVSATDNIHIDESLNTITQMLQQGELAEAERLARELIQQKPHNFRVMHVLGMSLHQRGKHREAIYWLTKVARFTKERIEIGLALGESLLQLGRYEHAAKIYQKLIEETPEALTAYIGLTTAFRRQELYEDALHVLQHAISIAPHDASTYITLGALLRDLARNDEAIGVYQSLLSLQPNNAQALAHICDLTPHHTMEDASMQVLLLQLEAPETCDEDRVIMHLALGRAYEKLGKYDIAFEHVKKGNQLQRLSMRYAIEQDTQLFERIQHIFTAELLAKNAKNAVQDDSTIMIVGMPRSGASLLEQILASHTRISAGSDTPHLRAITMEAHAAMERFGFPDYALHLSEEGIQAMGIEYLQRRHNRTTSRYVTDNTPSSFIYLGMAKLLLPNAKIIHITRDKMDSCLSAYQQHFTYPHPFAYDLRELGEFHLIYDALMAHWKTVLPEGSILEIAYEDLVSSPQTTLVSIMHYLGLDWDDACMKFYDKVRAISSHSASHIRSPLYTSAIGKARHYGTHLLPLRKALKLTEEPATPALTAEQVATLSQSTATSMTSPLKKKPSGLNTLKMVSGFGSAYLFRSGTLEDSTKENTEIST